MFPIVLIEVDLEGDGETSIDYVFPVAPGKDGRYNRAFAPKFTVNGTWPLIIKAYDTQGAWASMRCTPGIQVTF